MKYLSLLLVVFLLSCQTTPTVVDPSEKIDHIVVIYLENHSFYNLFAAFPDVDNRLPDAYKGQVDAGGRLYKNLPQVTEYGGKKVDARFPKNLPNTTFPIDQYVKISDKIPDPSHEFYTHIAQVNGGKMDGFARLSKVGGLPMGYYDMSKTRLWQYAQEYTLADHFFQSAWGGSFINHQYLIAAQTPLFESAPESMKTVLDKKGVVKKGGLLTPDGYAVNTVQPRLAPYDPKYKDEAQRLQPLDYANIGDRLTEAKISWGWYAGGWKQILNGQNPKDFQYHHQPFLYFAKYGPGTDGRREHLKDEDDMMTELKEHRFPQVVFYKPVGDENAHPGYSDVESGDQKVYQLVEALKQSPYWKKTLIVITFDEHGGFWDPAQPPAVDKWGPGTRIPAIFVSPLVKKGHIDRTTYETTSILSFLEKRFGLPPLTDRDRKADPLSGIFEKPVNR